MDYEVMTL